MRLVNVMDDLLEILERDPSSSVSTSTGRPSSWRIISRLYGERAGLRKFIQEGRLVIGPWYILPDEFLVTGESTVRNLIFGAAVGSRFGKISNVGYLPDTFGHFSQIPQILKQWGIPVAILWRGLSEENLPNELEWESPDGSSVVLWHIPEEFGYINAALFVGSTPFKKRAELIERGMHPLDMVTGEDAVDALAQACEFIKSKAVTDCHVLFNGVDHMSANPEIPELIRKVNECLKDGEVVHASFDQFAEALLEAVKGKSLRKVTGELRDTIRTERGGGIVLNGVLSSRIYLKQQNQTCCTLLENWAEPFSAFRALIGGKYEKGFLDRAWQWVLKNHPHDSIGGCSIDAVHRQMETRFEWAKEIADNLLQFTFTELLENVKIEGVDEGEYAFAIFNPSQWKQSGWIEAELEIPWTISKTDPPKPFRGVKIMDLAGAEQKSWLVKYEHDKVVGRPALRTFAMAHARPTFTVSLWVDDVPAWL